MTCGHATHGVEQSIAERDDVSADRLDDGLLSVEKPLVLRGLVSNWPATRHGLKSTDEVIGYLLGFDSGNVVTAMDIPANANGRIFYNSDLTDFNFKYRRLTLKDAVTEARANAGSSSAPSLYVGSTNVDHWLPGFREQNDLPLEHLAPLASIWLGNRSLVAAHFDFPSNIACVVAGRRRVIVFPPEQLRNLYVGPLDVTPAGQAISTVDFYNPDYDRFPRFRDALKSARSALLEPGDAIIIPSMWWHQLEALDAFNVLVNYWWRNSPSFMGAPLNVLQHAILGLRDLPELQRKQWRDLFEFYVFNPDPENFAHIPEAARGVLNSLDEKVAQQMRKLLRDRLL